ncbi:hypothetical protein cypCar_00009514 [Cyprinus carpio]|nr:hypothetical protein cypCar_00009514 [Cyprinus carpio]
MNFMKSLTLKNEEEKNEFFKFLLDRVQNLPEELIATRLTPKLLNSLVFAEPMAVKSFLPHLLRPKQDSSVSAGEECLLSLSLYRRYVVPQLLKLYKVNEEHVRIVLLSHIHIYAEFFPHEELKNQILPQGSEDKKMVLDNMYSFKATEKTTTQHTTSQRAVFSSEMNGCRMGTQAADNTKTNSTVRSDEDWPNWSDTEEAEKDKTQSVQISIRSAGIPGQSNSALSADNEDESEEPWDDFEDSEVTSDRSPLTPLPVSVPKTSTKSTASSLSESSAGPPRQSQALKLNSSVRSNPDHNHTSSWDTGWNQTTDTLKPSKTSLALEPKPKSTIKSSGAGCLGEEFTIAVKKKPQPDPELDFFADMVPDIKLSSSSLLLPMESSVRESNTGHTTSDPSIDTLSLTTKFAAAELTETEAEGWGDDLTWEDENAW